MSTEVESKTHCTEASIPELNKNGNPVTNCTEKLDKDKFKRRLIKEFHCNGTRECVVDIERPDLSWLTEIPSKDSTCGDLSFLYVQVGCQIDIKEMDRRTILGLQIGCIGVVVYISLIVYFNHI
jgi:hypothetical protein